jgi:hypothetical protein
MQAAQIETQELEKKPIDALKTYGKPASIGFVAFNLQIVVIRSSRLRFLLFLDKVVSS